MNAALNTTTRPAPLSRRDLADIAAFRADLVVGKVGLGWTPFVLTFREMPVERLEWALAEVRALADGECDPYLYEPRKVERFARSLGAKRPELFVSLINACAAASDRQPEIAGILRAAEDTGSPLPS